MSSRLGVFQIDKHAQPVRTGTENPDLSSAACGETKRPPRQKGGLLFQGRIVLTEGKVRQNFLAKSYESKKQGVKEILDNKCLCFQCVTNCGNMLRKSIILRPLRTSRALTRHN